MYEASTLQQDVTQWGIAPARRVSDRVLEETPVAMVYNGISHAVMLASPIDLEDFAVGFSITEGIVESAAQIHDVELEQGPEGIALQVRIAEGRMAALRLRRRALAGRTGCGLCGIESLAQAVRPPKQVDSRGHLRFGALEAAFERLSQGQALHRETGAAHAAGFAAWDGELQLLREDVGRHNALDKLVGAMALASQRSAGGFALVTSRASFEMVHKTAAGGIGMLAALSAPTGLAIRAAQVAGVTLIGFAGRQRRLIYSHPERIVEVTPSENEQPQEARAL